MMVLLGFAVAWFVGLRLDLRPLLWWLPFASFVLLLAVDRRPLSGHAWHFLEGDDVEQPPTKLTERPSDSWRLTY